MIQTEDEKKICAGGLSLRHNAVNRSNLVKAYPILHAKKY
jgi:hypothetical protein